MLQAVIFDLDGTILTNEDEYGAAFAYVLMRLGREVGDKYPQVAGIGVKEYWPQLLKKYKIKTDKSLSELAAMTQEAYLTKLSTVTLKEGFLEFVQEVKASGILTGLATSNTWNVVDLTLNKFGLENTFDTITTEEEVYLLKPAPDLFLKTAEKLGIDPSGCVVFEDAESGITAARGAKMKVVGVARDKNHAKTLTKADLVVMNFSELTVSTLNQLWP
jgi:HAD superfamily hydrolase (TIGR01509 family)